MITKLSRRSATLASCLVLAASTIGCTELPTAPSGHAAFSQTDLRAGAGTPAANGNTLVVNYTGWLYDANRPEQKGLQFDTSAGRGPLEFMLGQGQVIAGWDLGLAGMRAGGLRRLIIPPGLAYGGARQSVIPAYATLVFDVELIEVRTE